MQSGTGIQELMAAETRASQIVAEARIGESRVLRETSENAAILGSAPHVHRQNNTKCAHNVVSFLNCSPR